MPSRCLFESRLMMLFPELRFSPDSQIAKYLAYLRELARLGCSLTQLPATLVVEAHQSLGSLVLPFKVIHAGVEDTAVRNGEPVSAEDEPVEARVKILFDGEDKPVYKVADGDGPVNAYDLALRKLLEERYKFLRGIRLTDFRSFKLGNGDGSAASIAVVAWFGDDDPNDPNWLVVGVSTNILKASWRVLYDAMVYKLIKEGVGFSQNTAIAAG